jgi:glycine hydroxymethyltransferase
VDLDRPDITGKDADAALGRGQHHGQQERGAERPAFPGVTSGIRIGTPAVTTRGFQRSRGPQRLAGGSPTCSTPAATRRVNRRVRAVLDLCRRFPVYGDAEPGRGAREGECVHAMPVLRS